MSTKRYSLRITAIWVLLAFLSQLFFPTISWALTSGPSTPEVQTFAPVDANDMVDPFTGDFSYNIPLFELPGPNGGYPFNLLYNAGIGMDQEASWVGLGWNLNVGAITRDMRGIPDEWNGDATKGQQITREMDINPNWTAGISTGGGVEIFGGSAVSAGPSIYINSYKGIGYSMTIGQSYSIGNCSDGVGAAVGLDISLDSQEGLGVNPSLSLQAKGQSAAANFSVGVGYSSSNGLSSLSLNSSVNAYNRMSSRTEMRTDGEGKGRAGVGGTAAISIGHIGYTPQMTLPMQGRNIDLNFKLGVAIAGVYGNFYGSGFFNTSYLSEKSSTKKAYGFMHLEEANTDNVLLDFNREKDGMVKKNTPNLAIPSTTFDIYTISGHGTGGMYRAFRNDIPVLFDNQATSIQTGGSAGVDIGPGVSPHVGIQVTVNYTESISGGWADEGNDITNLYPYNPADGGTPAKDFELAYLKSYGEHTARGTMGNTETPFSSHLQNTAPIQPDVETTGAGLGRGYNVRKTINGNDIKEPGHDQREARNTLIHPVNGDKSGSQGYYVVNSDGTRYVYGLPAMNTKHVECLFSVDESSANACNKTIDTDGNNRDGAPVYKKYGEEGFLSRNSFGGGYAYAFHLTQILGPDYVDANQNGQVDDADYGYWVKFTYDHDHHVGGYKWRAPFFQASYDPGNYGNKLDGKGSYLYGEKEVYFLTQAETKTHIADFELSSRIDAKGAMNELQNKGATLNGTSLFKLDKIKVYAKNDDSRPLKTIYFQYDHLLCPGTDNTDQNASVSSYTYTFSDNQFQKTAPSHTSGKLTLKKVYTTYQNNIRGALSPYEFTYASSNPTYETGKVDRWGSYKSDASCGNMPYVTQFDPSKTDDQFQTDLSNDVASWSLTNIALPTGANLNITYESDDYGYVQSKTAMQMFQVERVNKKFDDSRKIEQTRFSANENRRVYFRLEHPVKVGDDIQGELAKYSDAATGQMYFKIYINLLNNSRPEYVSGYADVESFGADDDGYCVETIGTDRYYTKAYVVMASVNGYHPFSAAAWQHIRTNEPLLMGISNANTGLNDKSGTGKIISALKGMATSIGTLISTFTGFRAYALLNHWGNSLADDGTFHSVIRLNSPDKKKYGGGLRVKKIELSDAWDVSTGSLESASRYGQTYDYTMEEDGQTISSGVAAYEPVVGGDENALRYAKKYKDNIPLKTDNNLFFEYPINENYYPSPQVGYRKVTIRSLASYNSQDAVTTKIDNMPSGVMATGGTVYEFYTAKDFPVVTGQSNVAMYAEKTLVPIPLIGALSVDNLTATQGYTVELNDMHGKSRQISSYAQDGHGNLLAQPTSYVKYNYHSTITKNDGDPNHDTYVLSNSVPVLLPVAGSNVRVQSTSLEIGTEYEIFMDKRLSKTKSTTGGLSINTDVLIFGPIVIPAFVPWPNIRSSKSTMRTTVCNKVIHRFGIPSGVEAYDNGSTVTSIHRYYDPQTGEPVLTSVTNRFDDPVYDYTISAFSKYPGMGPAYQNVGINFDVNSVSATAGAMFSVNAGSADAFLRAGDVLSAYNKTTQTSTSVTVQKKQGSTWLLKTTVALSGNYTFEVVQSGYKNILSASAGNIKAVNDPVQQLLQP